MSLKSREAITFYIFMAPIIIGLLVFIYIPTLASLIISFTSWSMLESPEFIGLANYVEIFSKDIHASASARATVIYSFGSVAWALIVSLSLALFLNRDKKGVGVFRTLYYLPSMIVAGAPTLLIFSWIFSERGFVNTLLWQLFRVDGPNYFRDMNWALPTIMFMSVWGLGGSFVIFMAGLKSVPDELYESASLDGANSLQRLWNITLPSISPVILFNIIMGLIGSFQAFTQSYALTKGGPADSTLLWVLHIYKQAFEYFRMGYASALAWLLFMVIMILTLIILNTSAKVVFYAGDQSGSTERF